MSRLIEKLQIVKNFKIFSIIAALCVCIGLVGVLLLPFGVTLFNLDIDFVGGTSMHLALHTDVNSQVQSDVAGYFEDVAGIAPSSVQKTGDGTEVIIKSKEISTQTREEVFQKLAEVYSLTDDDSLNIENVAPAVGKDLQRSAVLSSIVAVVLMLVYITFRFEFKSGVAAVVCLVHDLLVMLSFYIIFRIPMNMTFVAAALTIFGYSINASIITFDRVRENNRHATKNQFPDIVENSIKQTFARSVNTTLTTLFTIGMIAIMGVPSLRTFALPIVVGILAGAFSSIFLAGPLWVKLRMTQKKKA